MGSRWYGYLNSLQDCLGRCRFFDGNRKATKQKAFEVAFNRLLRHGPSFFEGVTLGHHFWQGLLTPDRVLSYFVAVGARYRLPTSKAMP